MAPVPLGGVAPVGAVGGTLLRRPPDANTGDIREHEPRVPEHQQRRVQCGKYGFANHAAGGVEQAAKLFAARPVAGEIHERKKFWQHDDDHADDEN